MKLNLLTVQLSLHINGTSSSFPEQTDSEHGLHSLCLESQYSHGLRHLRNSSKHWNSLTAVSTSYGMSSVIDKCHSIQNSETNKTFLNEKDVNVAPFMSHLNKGSNSDIGEFDNTSGVFTGKTIFNTGKRRLRINWYPSLLFQK